MATVIKKIIITLGLALMRAVDLRVYAASVATNATTFSVAYPTFDPTPSAMQTLVTTGNSLASQKTLLEDQLRTITESELANRASITKGLTKWAGAVQEMTGLTAILVTQLGFRIRVDGTDNRVEMLNSSPIVNKANQSTSKKIALELINSFTNKKPKPYGAKGWIPFIQIGGVKPTSHDSMTAEIPTGKMKYSKTFAAGDLGKQFYITFVWFDGTEFIGPDSPIYSFTII